ncbi:hypothetical protein D3C78_1533200 [compost metagenome]
MRKWLSRRESVSSPTPPHSSKSASGQWPSASPSVAIPIKAATPINMKKALTTKVGSNTSSQMMR